MDGGTRYDDAKQYRHQQEMRNHVDGQFVAGSCCFKIARNRESERLARKLFQR